MLGAVGFGDSGLLLLFREVFAEPVPDPLGDLVARYARTHCPFPASAAAQQAKLGGRLPSVICSIQDLIKAFNDGKVQSYGDVIAMSR